MEVPFGRTRILPYTIWMPAIDTAQLAMLEREVADLRREVEQLKSVREFEHALHPGAARQLEQPKG